MHMINEMVDYFGHFVSLVAYFSILSIKFFWTFSSCRIIQPVFLLDIVIGYIYYQLVFVRERVLELIEEPERVDKRG